MTHYRVRKLISAPAPEVQGTPFKDEVLAMGGNESDAKAAILRAHAEGKVKIDMDWNVGTPQKETPPTRCPTCKAFPYPGSRRGFCLDDWHGQFNRSSQTVQAESEVAPVPEGVQGKEPPQIPCDICDYYESAHGRGISEIRDHKFSARGYLRGEAAGRRSAITEIQERAYEEARAGNQIHAKDIADWCAELQEKTKP